MRTFFKSALLLGVGIVSSSLLLGQTMIEQDSIKEQKIKATPIDYLKKGGQIQVVPEFNSKEEKLKWFNQNKIDMNQNNARSIFIDPPKNERVILNISDYPKFILTGNDLLDEQNYAVKKSNWIANNPNKYNQLSTPSNTPMSENEKKERFMNTN
jgi:myo-inositol-1-phosphate synthase